MRLPHFRFEFTPSNGEEIQSEYLLPREHALAAIDALRNIGPLISPILQVSEIRTVASDSLWVSGSYERETVAFHFTWLREQPRVEDALIPVEEALAPFQARPHWGKVFLSSAAEIDALYPKINQFRALARRYDPDGVFQNEFTRRYLGL